MSPQASAELIAAIQSGRAADWSAARLETHPGDEAAQQVQNATAAIGREVDVAMDHAEAVLAAAGITAQRDRGVSRQYHLGDVRIEGDQLMAALVALDEAGFDAGVPIDERRVAALRAYRDQIIVTRFDDATTRMRLNFKKRLGLPGALTPGIEDIAAAALPTAFYPASKIIRVLAERLTKSRNPRAESDFLGTPSSLILPLLERAGVRKESHLVDLGCGDGRVLEIAARHIGCRVTGIDMLPELVARAKQRLSDAGLDGSAELRQGDIMTEVVEGATHLFAFLPMYLLARHLPGIRAAHPCARVIAHEQATLHPALKPDLSTPVLAENALTVLHLWEPLGPT